MPSPKTGAQNEVEIIARGGQPTGTYPLSPAAPADASLRVPFTVMGLSALQPPASGEINIRDESTPGLFYRLRSTGGGSFVVRYRVKGQDTPKRMTLGTADLGQKTEDRTDLITIAEARKRAKIATGKASAGEDPAQAARAVSEARKAASAPQMTLAQLVDAYEADQVAHGIVSAAEGARLLRRELKPLLDTDPATITRAKMVELVNKVRTGTLGHAKPRPGTARMLRTLSHGLFEHAVNGGTLMLNPMAGYRIKRRSKAQRLADAEKKAARAVMLTMEEVAALWRACSDTRVNSTFGKYVQLLILSGTRRKEQAQARLSWIAPATNERPALLTIPAAHTKSARAHVVPLTPLAVSVINGVQRFRDTDFLTPGAVSKKTAKATAIAGWSKSWPKVLAAAKDYGLTRHVKLHDLRRTFRSHLSRLGVPDRVAEAMLNHAPNDPLIVAYDLHDFLDERIEAASKWATEIDRALSDADGGGRSIGVAVSAQSGAEVVALRPALKRRRSPSAKNKGVA